MTCIPNRSAHFAVMLGLLATGAANARCMNHENTSIPENTPTASYTVLADGTVIDPVRGLMWMRCLYGQMLANGMCTGTAPGFAWVDAIGAAHALSFAGHSDWRLPNAKELLSIYDDRCAGPSLNADLFPIADQFLLWTAAPAALDHDGGYLESWAMSNSGELQHWLKNSTLNILLVRDTP